MELKNLIFIYNIHAYSFKCIWSENINLYNFVLNYFSEYFKFLCYNLRIENNV